MIYLLLCLSISFAVYIYLSPRVRGIKLRAIKSKKPKEKSKNQLKREQQLMLIDMELKDYKRWQIVGAIVLGIINFLITLNPISAIIYIYVGYLLVDILLTLQARRPAKTLADQTQQFISNIGGFLNTGSNITLATNDASLQLRDPLRSHVRLAVNEAKGQKSLPETISDLGKVLYIPVYDLLGRLIGKGMETGQNQIAFAFEELRIRLQEIEKIILERANTVGIYLWWLVGITAIGPLSDILSRLIWSEGYEINRTIPLVSIITSFLDALLILGIRKYIRVYCERNDL